MSCLLAFPVAADLRALRTAFPSYEFNLIVKGNDKPRYEAVSRSGQDPVCLISVSAQEIYMELGGPREPAR